MANINKITLNGTDYKLVDSTVPSWAKQSTKPTYNGSEIKYTGASGNTVTSNTTLNVAILELDNAINNCLKYEHCNQTDYNNITNKDNGTLYIVEEEQIVDYSTKYLTLTALGNSVISVKSNDNAPNIPTIWYSTNDGNTWNLISVSTTESNLATLSNGESVLVKGTQSGTSKTGYVTISGTGNFSASGNVMSLIYGDNFVGQTSLVGKDYALSGLFYLSEKLINVDNLILPALELSLLCYKNMFRQTSITSTPELPATTLAEYCYWNMFLQCTLLVKVCELPAVNLAKNCYTYMFRLCTSLVNALDILPATTLALACYSGMFYGCTALTTAPVLPALNFGNLNCYDYLFYLCTSLNYIKAMFTSTPSSTYTKNWVYGVSSTGTFIKNSAATWNVTGYNGIPSGWTVQTASS